jgi:hypothetical protein
MLFNFCSKSLISSCARVKPVLFRDFVAKGKITIARLNTVLKNHITNTPTRTYTTSSTFHTSITFEPNVTILSNPVVSITVKKTLTI